MRPDTSRWREHNSYEIFDELPNEGLAWECLRRNKAYQHRYRSLIAAKADADPLPLEDQHQWGLRFRGPAEPRLRRANRLLVAGHGLLGAHADVGAGPSRSHLSSGADRP